MTAKPNKTVPHVCPCGATFDLLKTTPWAKCGKCTSTAARSRAKSAKYHQRPGYQKKARNWRLKKYYNLTSEQFDAMEKSQDGRCAICYDPPPDGEFLVVDHDHQTGKIRGLLCHNCNRSIGGLKDSIKVLRATLNYLIRYQRNQDEPELG
jgi:hypothetical protein